MADCKFCWHPYCEYAGEQRMVECANYTPLVKQEGKTIEFKRYNPKPATNADRIRAMSDEELAKFIEGESWMCNNYDVCDECPMCMTQGDCFSVLEWLKQPVKDGEDDG